MPSFKLSIRRCVPRRGRRAFAVLVLCALPLSGAMLPSARAARLPLLGHEGRWVTDPQGRVVILHGVQIDKWKPARPVNIIDLSPEHAAFIAAQGFNVARVNMTYSGVEPEPGRFDESYIESYRAFDGDLARAGVYDLLDIMQGAYGEAVGGWGFPDWMTITDGLPNTRDPYPRGYFTNPAENAAWDNLWKNTPARDGVGLQDHYAAGLRHLAERFADSPALLGIEILNEPWPGSPWPTCANPVGCPPGGFDQTSLTDFYRRVIAAIRAADPDRLIVYEPNLLFDFGAPTALGDVRDRNLVFAFHNYCLGRMPGFPMLPDPTDACGANEEIVFDNADAHSARTGDALLMDEFAGSTDDTVQIERMAREADQHMVGWSYWAYEDCCNSPAAIVKDGPKPPTAPGNLNLRLLHTVVRPYPQAVAGTPTGWRYEPSSGRFRLAYSTRAAAGGSLPADALTQIEVPPLKYPTGYSVDVRGAHVVSLPDADPLLLRSDPSAERVDVTVAPADHHPKATGIPGRCPDRVRRLGLGMRRHGPAITASLQVNGVVVRRVRGRNLRRLRLAGGLPDGSLVQTVATTARGVRVTTTREIRDCHPTRPRVDVRAARR